MKNLLFILTLVFPFLSNAQPPDAGDYVMTTWPDHATAHYVFKNKKVYFGFDPATKKSEFENTGSSKSVKELFSYTKVIDFSAMKGLDEKKLPAKEGVAPFRIIEVRKDGKVYRVCFEEYAEDEQSQKLATIVSMLNNFW